MRQMGYHDPAFPIVLRGPSRRFRRLHIAVERRLVIFQLIQNLGSSGESKVSLSEQNAKLLNSCLWFSEHAPLL